MTQGNIGKIVYQEKITQGNIVKMLKYYARDYLRVGSYSA